MVKCAHQYMQFGVIGSVGFTYRPPSESVIQDALSQGQCSKKKKKDNGRNEIALLRCRLPPAATFPAPVIIPDDLLFEDEWEDLQPVKEWEEFHDEMSTKQRKTVYLAHLPMIPKYRKISESTVIEGHAKDRPERKSERKNPPRNVRRNTKATQMEARTKVKREPTESPSPEQVLKYLQAFYHGFPVQHLEESQRLAFAEWEDDASTPTKNRRPKEFPREPSHIGITYEGDIFQVRCRTSLDGLFKMQVNLSDLLDVAIDVLPKDAYTLLIIVDYDLYEDEDDEFCCGRAYGRSRVAVVSTARYNPDLDEKQGVDVEHAWPASHCCTWIARHYTTKSVATNYMTPTETLATQNPISAVAAAVVAHNALPDPLNAQQRAEMWLGRVCKTASHELGHCFGIDHCSYYACIMQGTANIKEDVRQPPYLCPVDLTKMLRATGSSEKARYSALLEFCEQYPGDMMFAALGAWLRVRLKQPDIISV